ncbi:MAG: sensor histidine kinase [Janthinobacterium lividum]
MYSVRLSDIPRTISFRTGLMFLGLFLFSFLALFGYIYWQTTVYLRAEADAALHRQADNRSRLSSVDRLQEILVHNRQDADQRTPHSLFDAEGNHLAGAVKQLPDTKVFDRPSDYNWHKADDRHRPLRFMLHRLDDGNILMVAQDAHDIHEFNELLVRAMISGGVLLLLVGLVGSIALGYFARRRLDSLSHSISEIVKGDLSRRLPTRGNNDDVDRIAMVVNGMLDELERLMSEVKGVCDDIAHDLRTPLTRLMAGLERAQRRGVTADDYARTIDAALSEAGALLSTFRALLRISEIEDSARRSHFAPVDLNLVAADAAELFEPLAEERGISLTYAPSPNTPMISGDAQLLFDATCNLLDNAIKFSPDQGAVHLSISDGPEGVSLHVSDNGPGIAEAEREAVLRRLYRAEASRHTPGNGLGLSMVAAVARLHDMSLRIGDAQPGCLVELRFRPARG